MQNSKNMRKRATAAVGVATAAALMVGSLAFFTDRVSLTGNTAAGKLAIGITSATIDENGNFSKQLENTQFSNVQNLNPGDYREISYTINNLQNKAVRVNDLLTVTVTPDPAMMVDGDSTNTVQKMAESLKSGEKVQGFIHLVEGTQGSTKQIVTDTAGTEHAVDFSNGELALVDSYVTADNKSIVLVYQGSEVDLSGKGDNSEVLANEQGTWFNETLTDAPRSYTLYFESTANNTWQGATVKVDAQIDAIQRANSATNDATVTVGTGTIEEHGSHNVDIKAETTLSPADGK